jgi:hypothetical protein
MLAIYLMDTLDTDVSGETHSRHTTKTDVYLTLFGFFLTLGM